MDRKNFMKGALLTAFGACCWGISGNVGQFLATSKNFEIEWIVTFRLLCAGILLLTYLYIKKGDRIFDVWKTKQTSTDLILFSLFGMVPSQYTFFAAIKYSNAATATVLQYTGPVIILLYLAILQRKMPSKVELIAVFFALFGTFLLATNGNIHTLSISPLALFWGGASAVSMAIYTLQPRRLLETQDSPCIIGWSMLIGGILLSFRHPIFPLTGTLDLTSILCLSFILLFGTILGFCFYMLGIKNIGATKASLFASVEPLSSAIVSIVWLNEKFTLIDLLGFAFIVMTIFLLSVRPLHSAVETMET